VPETADGYTVNLDGLETWTRDADDPALKALREGFKEMGKTQGAVDDALDALRVLSKAGLIPPPFDAQAEVAKLGDGGAERMKDVETFLRALHDRGELDPDEFAELMSVVPTAAGVRGFEKLRKAMSQDNTKVDPPADPPADPRAAKLAEARALRMDPKYETDPEFRKRADRAYQAAFE